MVTNKFKSNNYGCCQTQQKFRREKECFNNVAYYYYYSKTTGVLSVTNYKSLYEMVEQFLKFVSADPTQAAEAYEAALKGSPKDVQLVKKLGVALVKMHEYDKACQHYENAIRLLNDDDLQFEYYELLIKVSIVDLFFKCI